MSPVYPKYYVGGRRCKWTLRADPGQRIQLRFLDISLREEMSPSSQCTDSIRVTERGRNLLSMCGESKQDIVLLSEANKLEVRPRGPAWDGLGGEPGLHRAKAYDCFSKSGQTPTLLSVH